MSKKHVSIRIDEATLEKLGLVAKHYGLSKNELIVHLTSQCVIEFEKRKGNIIIEEKTQ